MTAVRRIVVAGESTAAPRAARARVPRASTDN